MVSIVEMETEVTKQLELDQHAPVLAGGFRVLPDGETGCTLGFLADGSEGEGYVSASHCSTQEGVIDYGNWWQPSSSYSTNYGYEANDIGFDLTSSSPGCPSTDNCRYADANFIRVYDNYDPQRVGKTVAKTTSLSLPELTLGSTNPSNWFSINGTVYYPSQGATVQKVGSVAGWTEGTIENVCFSPVPAGPTTSEICQIISNYDALGGDSGGPVFILTGPRSGLLIGTHIGQFGAPFGPYTTGQPIISAYRYIENYLTLNAR